MRKKSKRLVALLLSLLLIISMIPTTGLTVEAAAKPKLAKKSVSIVVGGKAKIKVKNAPKKAKITYKSAKKNVATVSKKGMVKGIKSGTTKITVSIKKNSKTTKLTYKVTVKKPKLSKSKLSLVTGGTAKLSVKNKPKKAKYTWKSSNPRIATVNKTGKVTAKAKGTANIKVKVKTAKKTYSLSCKVTVKAKPDNPETQTYTVTFDSNGGSAVASQTIKKNGFAKQPADPTRDGYTFDGWYTAANGGQKFNFNTAITDNITLYAHWNNVEAVDADGDGLLDVDEEALGTDPLNPDTDGDGLSDYEEIILGTDPLKPNTPDSITDSDSDGLTDLDEVQKYRTDPYAVDTDNDGLNDYDEIFVYKTDPLNLDTDGDGLSDGFETEHGLDPTKTSTDGVTNDSDFKIEQKISETGISLDLRDERNVAQPSISGYATGELANNVFLATDTDSAFSDNRSVIGDVVYVDGSDTYVSGLSLDFDLTKYDGDLNNLTIVTLNGDGTFEPIESTLNHTTLTAQIETGGSYCVLDLDEFLRNLGFDLSSYWETNDEPTVSAYSAEPEHVSDSNANTIISVSGNNVDKTITNEKDLSIATEENSISEELESYESQVNSVLLDELNETNASMLSSSSANGQADIVFAIDTTGSMSDTIDNVVTNVISFATILAENYNVNANFALVDFKDIEEDGAGTTVVVKNGSSNWFSDVDTFINKVSTLNVDGGGDYEECDIDALETARHLDFRSSANKFIILITDAAYKIANDYGISSMDEEIRLLAADGIITSVVTSLDCKTIYQSLYETTGGIYADIDSNTFSSSLISLADMIGETTSDGTWVILKHGYRYVKLTDETDQDGDGLSTTYELGKEEEINLTIFIKALLAMHNIPFEEYIGKSTINVYNAKSDPTTSDTDNDGIADNKDTEAWKKGLKNGIIGALKICSSKIGTSSFEGFNGHAYVAYTSFINDTLELYGINVTSVNECAKEGDTRSDRPSYHNIIVESDTVTTIGGWAGWLPKELRGTWINNERELVKSGGIPSDLHSIKHYITQSDLEKIEIATEKHSKWTYLYNCSAFAVDVWNEAVNDNLSAKGLWCNPASLNSNMEKRVDCKIAEPLLAEWP